MLGLMEFFAHPLTIFAACALTLCAALALCLAVKRDVTRLRKMLAGEREARDAAEAGLRQEIRRLEEELEEERRAALNRSSPPQQSMNLSKRSQALRMHRMGEPPEKIARTLGLSRTEVDLLLKVHRAVLESVGEGARIRMEFATRGSEDPAPETPRGEGAAAETAGGSR
ncbi:MAG: DUF2802 domain-containing protein [Bryobacteraceae bacterium]|nr:DUF2802 domain-containing protein [Bryobacteraceae bacterium]